MSPPAHAAASFGELTDAFWTTEAVEAASELGVLRRLEADPVTVEDLATDCGLNPRHARLLLAALAGLGVAEPTDTGRYRCVLPGFAELAARFLASGGLTPVLSGAAPSHAADTVAGAQRLYPAVVRALGAVFQAAAERAADLLAEPGQRILDVGAGAAPWSLAIASRHSEITVVAVDLPDVIPATEAAVAEAGLADQFGLVAGDIFELDLDEDAFDLVIVGGVCHLFDEETNLRLIPRLAATLRPNGTLAVIEPLPNESLDGPLPVILYALGLATRTASGGVYPFSTYARWLRQAGFGDIGRHDLSDSPPVSLITAQRTPGGDTS